MWILAALPHVSHAFNSRGFGRHLVEVEGVDVNSRDRWDSVPLYYACACGARALRHCHGV